MRWEITKDKEDLYVLCINNIVVMISRDIYAIVGEITEDIENRQTNPKRNYEPAILALESSEKEIKESIIEDKPIVNGSLGRLFEL